MEDGGADVSDYVRRLGDYDQLLVVRPWHQLPFATLIVIACVMVAGFALTLRTWRTQIILTVKTTAVELKLAESWSWSEALEVVPSDLRFENLSMLELPKESTTQTWSNVTSAQVKDGQITLTGLSFGRHSDLRIEKNNGSLIDVYVRHLQDEQGLDNGSVPLQGAFELGGQPMISVLAPTSTPNSGSENWPELMIPETAQFKAELQGPIPARLAFGTMSKWVLNDLRVKDRLSFAFDTQRHPGTTTFISAITGGHLRLSDLGDKVIELHSGEPLTLKGITGRVTQIEVKDHIRLRFQGNVSEVRIGPEGFEQNLTPRLLEVLRHQNTWTLLWGAVVWLWGMLWGVKKMFFP